MAKLAQVFVLQPGYAVWQKKLEAQKADGTISLIKSEKNIVVDTGLPKDKQVIVKGLAKHGLKPADIDYVVCTHGDADPRRGMAPHASHEALDRPGATLIRARKPTGAGRG